MGMFDGVLGGLVGGEMASIVNGLIEKHGGVQGLIAQFEQHGLGSAAHSWVGTGPNQPVSSQQVQETLGSNTIHELAAKIGLHPNELATKLSQVLPGAVDHLTPGGRVPPQGGTASSDASSGSAPS